MAFKPRPIRSKFMDDYWVEFYSNGHCSLCGNHGIIDTTGRAITPAGVHVGRVNYCICPNGQMLRKHAIKRTGDRQVRPT